MTTIIFLIALFAGLFALSVVLRLTVRLLASVNNWIDEKTENGTKPSIWRN